MTTATTASVHETSDDPIASSAYDFVCATNTTGWWVDRLARIGGIRTGPVDDWAGWNHAEGIY